MACGTMLNHDCGWPLTWRTRREGRARRGVADRCLRVIAACPMPTSGAAMSAVMLMPRRQPWSYTADGMLIEPYPAPVSHELAA